MTLEYLGIPLTLLFFVSAAAIIYPFKPFGRRSRAIITLFCTLVVIAIIAPKGDESETTIAEYPPPATDTRSDNVEELAVCRTLG